jgi:antitoxin HicB
MRTHSIRKADLARRLGCHMRQVDRLLDLSHASRLDQIEAAFGALNKKIVIDIRDAA